MTVGRISYLFYVTGLHPSGAFCVPMLACYGPCSMLRSVAVIMKHILLWSQRETISTWGSRATLPIFFPLRPNRALASDLRTIERDDQIRMARDRPQLNKTRSFHSSITLVK